jgi:hypothetical protein
MWSVGYSNQNVWEGCRRPAVPAGAISHLGILGSKLSRWLPPTAEMDGNLPFGSTARTRTLRQLLTLRCTQGRSRADPLPAVNDWALDAWMEPKAVICTNGSVHNYPSSWIITLGITALAISHRCW